MGGAARWPRLALSGCLALASCGRVGFPLASDAPRGGRGGQPALRDAGVPEAGRGANLDAFHPSLTRRYSFDGQGTRVTDSVGAAHGTLVNTSLTGNGAVQLAGSTPNQYVDLPNGIVSSLVNATFEVWVTWNGTDQDHARIFDFGSTPNGEGNQGQTSDGYLYLTPAFDDTIHRPQASFTETGSSPSIARSSIDMPAGIVHMAVVFDDAANRMTLYINGVARGSTEVLDSLADLEDNNVWLGRSQFSGDHTFAGVIYEFRIYASALDARAIAASHAAGADPR